MSGPRTERWVGARPEGAVTRFWGEYALLPGGLARDVTFVVDGGRFAAVTPGTAAADAVVLPGVVLPGFADVHSHAFHRALRGRTHDGVDGSGGGTFWTWRERMYAVAGRLDPDSYLALARAAFAERALAGITAVGEFHYLHHAPGGRRYDDPNAMGHALAQAAAEAGIRLTLLDTCYLSADVDGRPVDGVQRRYSDGTAEGWADRVAALRDGPGLRIGVAAHSVRAVPRPALRVVADVAGGLVDGATDGTARQRRPLHVHLSEQPAENAACLAVHGLTPTGLLADEGLLGPATTAVHATHLTGADIALLGGSRTVACLCPTTERDLADGLGPARALRDAGCPLALGGDQHAITDPFEEARGLEMHERLASGQRGRFTPAELLDALTAHSSIGWNDAGRLATGARADLVAVRLDTPRTAGADPAQVVLVATAADVDTVLVDGRVIVESGQHVLGDVGALLQAAIEPLREDT